MSRKKTCKECGEVINHINPYCSRCQNIKIEHFGEYTGGLTGGEIDKLIGLRANTLSITNLRKKFNKIAGVNTTAIHTCESCGRLISLMYRHDVERYLDALLYGEKTYWD